MEQQANQVVRLWSEAWRLRRDHVQLLAGRYGRAGQRLGHDRDVEQGLQTVEIGGPGVVAVVLRGQTKYGLRVASCDRPDLGHLLAPSVARARLGQELVDQLA